MSASSVAIQRIHLLAPLAQHSLQPNSTEAALEGASVHFVRDHTPYQRNIAKGT